MRRRAGEQRPIKAGGTADANADGKGDGSLERGKVDTVISCTLTNQSIYYASLR